MRPNYVSCRQHVSGKEPDKRDALAAALCLPNRDENVVL